MTLAQLCPHDQLKEHFILPTIWSKSKDPDNWCSGAVLLPPDSLVITRDDPRLLSAWMDWTGQGMLELKYFLDALAAAQPGDTEPETELDRNQMGIW